MEDKETFILHSQHTMAADDLVMQETRVSADMISTWFVQNNLGPVWWGFYQSMYCDVICDIEYLSAETYLKSLLLALVERIFEKRKKEKKNMSNFVITVSRQVKEVNHSTTIC